MATRAAEVLGDGVTLPAPMPIGAVLPGLSPVDRAPGAALTGDVWPDRAVIGTAGCTVAGAIRVAEVFGEVTFPVPIPTGAVPPGLSPVDITAETGEPEPGDFTAGCATIGFGTTTGAATIAGAA